MKKQLLSVLLAISPCYFAISQNLVCTDPLPKNVVLEEFTGIHCQYCPDGHAIAQAISDNNPGRVVLVNIHQGPFASPSAGEPDYTTVFGDPLATQGGINAIGWPSGTVNRHLFQGNTSTGMGRSAWGVAAVNIMNQASPVNVGIQSEYESTTRTLTVTVEVYYTANSNTAVNYLNVALLQDSVYGPQTNGGAGNNYHHKHMLRHFITGQWGDTVNSTSQGNLTTKTYTYVVPLDYNGVPCLVEDCHVAAYVAESQQEILSGDVVYAVGGTNKYVGKLTTSAYPFSSGSSGNTTSFSVDAISALPGTESFLISLEGENVPADWSSNFVVGSTTYTSPATISLTQNASQLITVNILPGLTPKVSKYTLRMKSISNPAAPERLLVMHVIANVTDLVLNGSGGNETVQFESLYLDGLAYAANTHYASCNAALIPIADVAGALVDVNNIYFNVSWTFPAMKDSEVTALQNFMNAGGNLFVAGQDIGWDIMSGASGSNGTALSQDFYTNYMLANYLADGSSSNSQLTPVIADPVFGSILSSGIIDPFSGNMYPEEISPRTGAVAVFSYNNNTSKTAAIRGQTASFKVVYFGIGMEMVGNVSVKNQILKQAHDWFYGLVDTPELDGQPMTVSVFPNPASSELNITMMQNRNGLQLEVMDVSGRMLMQEAIQGGVATHAFDISKLESGSYFLKTKSFSGTVSTCKFLIVK